MTMGQASIRFFVLMALALPVSACFTNDLKSVEQAKSRGDAFDRALTEEYRKLARYEGEEMYDWPDAVHFARKGLLAADGGRPMPEDVAVWRVSDSRLRLEDARKRLSVLFARGAAERSPRLAARAQAAFDCWVEQQEEGWQTAHISACRSSFQAAVLTLERTLTTPYRISFDLDRSDLSPEEIAQIRRVAREAVSRDVPLASVVGYADRTGTQDYNMTLSLKRADAVRRALVAAGVPVDRIAVSAYGEDRVRVSTPDNVAEARNRRVEILFYPGRNS